MKDSNLGLLTQADLASKDNCMSLFSTLEHYTKELIPKYYSDNEPINNDFEMKNITRACESWGNLREGAGFCWRGNNPKSSGSVAFNSKLGHSTINLDFNSKKIESYRLVELFIKLSVDHKVDYGYLHAFSEQELDEDIYDTVMPYRIGVTTRDLEKGIPNINWLNAFGKPYIDLIGIDKLLSAPVFKIYRPIEDVVILQITKEKDELIENYEKLVELRRKLKAYLGSQYFGISGLAPNFCKPQMPGSPISRPQSIRQANSLRHRRKP